MSVCASSSESPVAISALLLRGFRRSCPCCGKGRLFDGYLQVVSECSSCGEELGHIRADDFPPYITIVIVGHIIVPLFIVAERLFAPTIVMHLMIWLPLTAALTYWFLPRAKGSVIGWMMHLGIRGDETQ